MQDLSKEQTDLVSGALIHKRPPITTLAVGEEGGVITTLAIGEEGPVATTLALGEEGGCGKAVAVTTSALGAF